MIWANEDALKAIKESSQTMRLNENAIAAIKATGITAKEFKIRQEFVEALGKNESSWAQKAMLEDSTVEQARRQYEEFMMDQLLSGGKMQQKVLPVTMIVDGERIEVGQALIEQRNQGYCVVHAVIDGEYNVAALLGPDLSQISIGNKDDNKKE